MYAEYPVHCRQQAHEFKAICVGPTYLGHTSSNFPRLILTDDLEPVLKSSKLMKMLNLQLLAQFLPTSSTNF